MTRKDSEKEAERPHYYSQFWLDVAAGRRVIGMPKPNEESDAAEPEAPEQPVRKASRVSDAITPSDGHIETITRPVAEPIAPPKEFIEPDEIEPEDEEPIAQAKVEDKDIPDMDLGSEAEDEEAEDDGEEHEEDEFFDEEEEEEDSTWGARGRKKPKPVRAVKQPPKKPVGKRNERRPGY